MILNCFNIIREIEKETNGFDDSIYIVDYNINNVKLSINSTFDWEKLTNKIMEKFPQGTFSFTVIALILTITWD